LARITLPLGDLDSDYLSQVEYSLAFADEDVASYEITVDGTLLLDIIEGGDEARVRGNVEQLLDRYKKTEFGLQTKIHYEHHRDLPDIDVWHGLIDRKWITPIGTGHVILRGPAANVMRLVDHRVQTRFADRFEAEHEIFPNTILAKTLDRVAHFSSFPEHVDFVNHLRSDATVLKEFADYCRENDWKPELHEETMAPPEFAISPSCCYHCYEGMEDWTLDAPGRTITATLQCHRYEGKNLTSMARLNAFTMREVVWVGHPKWVRDQRTAAADPLFAWAKDWELDCTIENANDMFFTDDFAVKASFQRQQEGKIEVRMRVPAEGRSISVASSNFHGATFGKSFNIKVGKRPAVSACMAWGYERWVYALFAQFGFDIAKWPEAPRDEYYALFGKE